jgi:hypothetical protein
MPSHNSLPSFARICSQLSSFVHMPDLCAGIDRGPSSRLLDQGLPLVDFFWRLHKAPPKRRGTDISVSDPSKEEEALAGKHFPDTAEPLVKFEVSSFVDGSKAYYIGAKPGPTQFFTNRTSDSSIRRLRPRRGKGGVLEGYLADRSGECRAAGRDICAAPQGSSDEYRAVFASWRRPRPPNAYAAFRRLGMEP